MMEKLVEIYWDPDTRRYSVSSRSGKDQGWATYEGSETEFDELLALARDIVTGG